MNELVTGFARLSHVELAARAGVIVAALSSGKGNVYFPATHPPLAEVAAAGQALEQALAMIDSKPVTALRHARRPPLILLLKELAADLERKAEGDMEKLAQTGYGLRAKPVRGKSVPEAPSDLRVLPGPLSGQLTARCDRPARTRFLELQITEDPVTMPWRDAGAFTDSRHMVVGGLPRGKDFHIRARAHGSYGPGPWSGSGCEMVR